MIEEKELDRTFYEIQVKGYLDARWNGLFERDDDWLEEQRHHDFGHGGGPGRAARFAGARARLRSGADFN